LPALNGAQDETLTPSSGLRSLARRLVNKLISLYSTQLQLKIVGLEVNGANEESKNSSENKQFMAAHCWYILTIFSCAPGSMKCFGMSTCIGRRKSLNPFKTIT